MRRTFLTSGDPQVEDKRWYVLQNWRQDPVAILDEARRPPRTQRERVFFSPYGRIFGLPATRLAGDTGFDGDYGAGDSTAISGWSTAYQAYADVDLDGDIDATDATFSTNVGMGWDKLSRDGSTITYAGYVCDDYIATVNHVRHRVMKTDLGRWVQRDPAGYVDGASLYEYVKSMPITMRDLMGLASGIGFGYDCGEVVTDGLTCGDPPDIVWPHPRDPMPIFTPPADPPVDPRAECRKCIGEAYQDPEVQVLLQEMRRRGCPLPDADCDDCDRPGTGGIYLPPRFPGDRPIISICMDAGSSCEEIKSILKHEMFHAYDDCQGAGSGPQSCCDCICNELRAYRYEGGCEDGGIRRVPGETEQQCLIREVGKSCGMPICSTDSFSACFSQSYGSSSCYPTSEE